MIESIIAGGYTPGVLTSIPYVVFGVLFMRAVVDEYRADTAVEAQRAPASCPGVSTDRQPPVGVRGRVL